LLSSYRQRFVRSTSVVSVWALPAGTTEAHAVRARIQHTAAANRVHERQRARTHLGGRPLVVRDVSVVSPTGKLYPWTRGWNPLDACLATPSPLNGERAGVRGVTNLRRFPLDPAPRLFTRLRVGDGCDARDRFTNGTRPNDAEWPCCITRFLSARWLCAPVCMAGSVVSGRRHWPPVVRRPGFLIPPASTPSPVVRTPDRSPATFGRFATSRPCCLNTTLATLATLATSTSRSPDSQGESLDAATPQSCQAQRRRRRIAAGPRPQRPKPGPWERLLRGERAADGDRPRSGADTPRPRLRH
jgi:hypothetical protein